MRDYAWGSKTGIQWFAGVGQAGVPLAEVWMGAHPTAPSKVMAGNALVGLDQVMASGGEGAEELPYLAKLLAAEKALSIQVHPDQETAEREFAHENERGLSLDSPLRTYRDSLHKPEVVYALTPFQLMVGLRQPAEARDLVSALAIDALAPLVQALSDADPQASCRDAFAWMLAQRDLQTPWLDQVIARAAELADGPEGLAYRVLVEVAESYPGDATALAPLLMNVMQLKPGQALYTAPRVLHSYLGGMAVEVMAASDNVIRGGLTPKQVLADDLLKVASFEPGVPSLLEPTVVVPGVERYSPEGIDDFAFDVVTVDQRPITVPGGGARIVLSIDGDLLVQAQSTMRLPRGASAFVSDADGPVEISGPGKAVVVFSRRG